MCHVDSGSGSQNWLTPELVLHMRSRAGSAGLEVETSWHMSEAHRSSVDMPDVLDTPNRPYVRRRLCQSMSVQENTAAYNSKRSITERHGG